MQSRHSNTKKKIKPLPLTRLHQTRSKTLFDKANIRKTKEFEKLLPNIRHKLSEKYEKTKYTHVQYAKPSLQKLQIKWSEDKAEYMEQLQPNQLNNYFSVISKLNNKDSFCVYYDKILVYIYHNYDNYAVRVYKKKKRFNTISPESCPNKLYTIVPILYTDIYLESLTDYGDDYDGHSIAITEYLYSRPQVDSHFNLLIYNHSTLEVERFEPHGVASFEGIKIPGKEEIYTFDNILYNEVVTKLSNGYKYIPPIYYCPTTSVQALLLDPIFKINAEVGFCVSWSLYYFHMRLINPELNREQLMKSIIKDFNSISNPIHREIYIAYTIRSYVMFVSYIIDIMNNNVLLMSNYDDAVNETIRVLGITKPKYYVDIYSNDIRKIKKITKYLKFIKNVDKILTQKNPSYTDIPVLYNEPDKSPNISNYLKDISPGSNYSDVNVNSPLYISPISSRSSDRTVLSS